MLIIWVCALMVGSLSQWQAIAALGNADRDDDRELAQRYLDLGLAFEAFATEDGKPILGQDYAPNGRPFPKRDHIPEFAARARKMLPELRDLLHSLATKRMSRAKQIVAKHKKHIRRVTRREWAGSAPCKGRGDLDAFMKALEEHGFVRRAVDPLILEDFRFLGREDYKSRLRPAAAGPPK
jgi:hypothetical protein